MGEMDWKFPFLNSNSMNRSKRIITFLLTANFLTSCTSVDGTSHSSQVVEVRQALSLTPAVSTIPVESRPEEFEAGKPPDVLTGEMPTQSQTTLTQTPILTPALMITGTQAISPTASTPARPEVISRTVWVTTTWSFQDLAITYGEKPYQAAWNQDGTAFAIGTSVGVFVYDGITLERMRAFIIGQPVYATVFSPGEGLLGLGLINGDIQWYVPASGEFISVFNAHLLGVRDLAFPAERQYLVSGSDDGTIDLWATSALLSTTAEDYSPMSTWRMPDRVTSVGIQQGIHQGRQLVAAGSYQSVSVWDIGSVEPVKILSDLSGWVNGLAFHPNGDTLAVIDSSDTIRLWETRNWYLTHQVQMGEMDQLLSLDFSPDGKFLALGGKNGRVVLWNLDSNTVSNLGDDLPHSVMDLRFKPSSDTLIACYLDGTIRLWLIQP